MDRRSFLAAAVLLPVIAGLRISREEKSYPIPAADGVQIDKDQDVIIARAQGKVFAFNLACPHQNTAIRWDGGKGRFQCPKHKSIYTPEGVFVEGRATRGLDRFAIRKDGNSIVVNLDSLFEQDKDSDKWAKAFVTP
jgi:Rieske Fe-S protein